MIKLFLKWQQPFDDETKTIITFTRMNILSHFEG